jgi:branched-chain amino acid transport system substrate-binding protein
MRRIVRGVVPPILVLLLLAACGSPDSVGVRDGGSPVATPGDGAAPQRPAAARGRSVGGPAPGPEGGGEPSEATLPLGAAIATTGNGALLGREELLGAEIAEEILNAQGGVAGRPVDVVVQDPGGDEDGARSAFQALINSDQVVGIVGPTLARQAGAVVGIAAQTGVPVLGPASATTGIAGDGAYFQMTAPLAADAPNPMDVALQEDPSITRIAFAFAQDDASSSSETVALQAAARERSLSISTVQTYRTTDTSLAPPAAAVVDTDPGLVVISGTAADGGALVRELRALGYDGPVVGGGGMNTAELFGVCNAACEGILLAQSYNPEAATAANEVFRRAFQERHGREPSQPSAQAFTSVQVLVEALRAVHEAQDVTTLDLAALRAALRTTIPTGEYETPLGTIAFTPEGEIVQQQTHVARIEMSEDGQTGRFVVVR